MIFSFDTEPTRWIASIQNKDHLERYVCSLSSCPNPVCTCEEASIRLAPLETQNDQNHPVVPHIITINIDRKHSSYKDGQKK